MKYLIILSTVFALMCSACSNKESTLLDFQPVYYNADSLLSVSISPAGLWRMATPDKLVGYHLGDWYELDLANKTLQTSPAMQELYASLEVYHSPGFDTVVTIDIWTGKYWIATEKGTNTAGIIQLPPAYIDIGNVGINGKHRIRRTKAFDARNALIMADYHPNVSWDVTNQGIYIYQIKNGILNTVSHLNTSFVGNTNAEGVDLAMLDPNTGFLIVRPRRDGNFDLGNDNRERRLLKTIDGGKTWQFISETFTPEYTTLDWLVALDEQHLVAGGYGGSWHSSDGGITWQRPQGYWGEVALEAQRLPSGKLVTVADTDYLQDAFYERPTELVTSDDSGASWMRNGPKFYGRNLHCFDDNNWVSGYGWLLEVTHDAGKTWELISAPLPQ